MGKPAELVPGEAVRLRLSALSDVLEAMAQAKSQQVDAQAPSTRRGVWVSQALWRAAQSQLELQMTEVLGWEQLLLRSQQDLESLRAQGRSAAANSDRLLAESKRQLSKMAAHIEALQEELQAERSAAAEERARREAQVADLQVSVREGETHAVAVKTREEELRDVREALAAAEQRGAAAQSQAEAVQAKLESVMNNNKFDATEHDALKAQLRDVTAALSESMARAEALRQQLAQRQKPLDEMIRDLSRLQADNERLVALLGATPEYRSLASDMSNGGMHYVPVSECLTQRGLVDAAYDPLLDRELQQRKAGGETRGSGGGKGSRKGGGGSEPDHDPEEWHWVPRQAVDATRALLRAQLPSAPAAPFMRLLLQLNKIWRQAEGVKLAAVQARHEEELREVHRLYRQRAPYEAIVADQKLSLLKRQVRLGAKHAQHLVGEAAAGRKDAAEDSKMILTLGLDSITTLTKQLSKALARNKRLARELAQRKWEASGEGLPVYCPACADRLLGGGGSSSDGRHPATAHDDLDHGDQDGGDRPAVGPHEGGGYGAGAVAHGAPPASYHPTYHPTYSDDAVAVGGAQRRDAVAGSSDDRRDDRQYRPAGDAAPARAASLGPDPARGAAAGRGAAARGAAGPGPHAGRVAIAAPGVGEGLVSRPDEGAAAAVAGGGAVGRPGAGGPSGAAQARGGGGGAGSQLSGGAEAGVSGSAAAVLGHIHVLRFARHN